MLDLAGWAFNITFFKSISTHWVPMKVITAICLILSVTSLLFILRNPTNGKKNIIPKSAGLLIMLTGMISCYIHFNLILSGNEISITEAPFFQTFLAPDNRMALLTAINFTFIGTIIVLLSANKATLTNIAHSLILPVLIISYLIPVSYILGVHSLHAINNISVALNTGIAFCALSLAIVFIKTGSWLMSVFVSKNAGGRMARRLLPALLFLPVIIGWFRLYGERTNIFQSEVGVVLVALTYSVCFVFLTWVTARSVNKSDEKKRRSEEQLHESEIKFRSIFENSNDAIILLDAATGKYIDCNDITCKMSGYSKKEICEFKSGEFLSPPHKNEVRSNMDILNKTGKLRGETELITKEGTLLPIEFNASLLKIEDAQYMVSFIRDISERKQAEESLRASEAKLRGIMEATQESIWMFSITGEYLLGNPTALWRIGKSEKEIIGKNFTEILPYSLAQKRMGYLRKVVETATPIEFEDERDGINFLHNFYPLFDNGTNVIAVVSFSRDITERKKVELELENKNAKLLEINDTKDKFFKIIAHDMRNPFISLIGASELLYENAHKYDLEKISTLSKVLNDSAKSGFDMLLNLLEWAKSQAGSMVFVPEEIDLKSLIYKNLSSVVEIAASKKIDLNVEDGNGVNIRADKNMLETILRNLISNALKFTSKGGVVTVSSKNENGSVVISVKDTGMGIDNKNFDKLFRNDIKFSNPGTERECGSGLGLLLCKEFVEKHNGKIWVESEVEKGSTFHFSLGKCEN